MASVRARAISPLLPPSIPSISPFHTSLQDDIPIELGKSTGPLPAAAASAPPVDALALQPAAEQASMAQTGPLSAGTGADVAGATSGVEQEKGHGEGEGLKEGEAGGMLEEDEAALKEKRVAQFLVGGGWRVEG